MKLSKLDDGLVLDDDGKRCVKDSDFWQEQLGFWRGRIFSLDLLMPFLLFFLLCFWLCSTVCEILVP